MFPVQNIRTNNIKIVGEEKTYNLEVISEMYGKKGLMNNVYKSDKYVEENDIEKSLLSKILPKYYNVEEILGYAQEDELRNILIKTFEIEDKFANLREALSRGRFSLLFISEIVDFDDIPDKLLIKTDSTIKNISAYIEKYGKKYNFARVFQFKTNKTYILFQNFTNSKNFADTLYNNSYSNTEIIDFLFNYGFDKKNSESKIDELDAFDSPYVVPS